MLLGEAPLVCGWGGFRSSLGDNCGFHNRGADLFGGTCRLRPAKSHCRAVSL